MAGLFDSAIDTGLPLLPAYGKDSDPELYLELVRLYNAVRSIQYAYDTLAGSSGEIAGDVDYNSYTIGNLSRFTTQYAVAATFGQLVAVNAANSVKLAQGFTATTPVKAIGICAEPDGVPALGFGRVQTSGILSVTGLTAGAVYCLAPDGGLVDAAAYKALYFSTYPAPGPAYPVTWYYQIIGTAISNDKLLLTISPEFTKVTHGWTPVTPIVRTYSEEQQYG